LIRIFPDMRFETIGQISHQGADVRFRISGVGNIHRVDTHSNHPAIIPPGAHEHHMGIVFECEDTHPTKCRCRTSEKGDKNPRPPCILIDHHCDKVIRLQGTRDAASCIFPFDDVQPTCTAQIIQQLFDVRIALLTHYEGCRKPAHDRRNARVFPVAVVSGGDEGTTSAFLGTFQMPQRDRIDLNPFTVIFDDLRIACEFSGENAEMAVEFPHNGAGPSLITVRKTTQQLRDGVFTPNPDQVMRQQTHSTTETLRRPMGKGLHKTHTKPGETGLESALQAVLG